jgi:hypothetical protein
MITLGLGFSAFSLSLRQVLLLFGNDRVYELAASKLFDNTT